MHMHWSSSPFKWRLGTGPIGPVKWTGYWAYIAFDAKRGQVTGPIGPVDKLKTSILLGPLGLIGPL